jgi:hypothetical protein
MSIGPTTNPFRIPASVGVALAVVLAGAPYGATAQTAVSIHTQEPGTAAVVEVDAEDFAFRMPAEIGSGWTTFRLTNQGEEHHFMLIARLPAGMTYDDYVTDVVMPFNEVWYDLRDGRLHQDEVMPILGEELPEWFWGVEFMGGVGFLAPGEAGEATVNLEPGRYVVECYMRTADGEFHSMEGMLDPLTVTEARSRGEAPSAALRVVLSEEGMSLEGRPEPGTNTFQVHWADHPEGTFGHDVHVVRVDDDTTTDDVVRWMNFLEVDALTEPAPGTFVGGINMMPAGSTAYFSVDLEPGRYLFVSEYTGAMGVLEEVTVEAR